MEIVVVRGIGAGSGKPYYCIKAVNEVIGEVALTFDKGIIAQVLPYGYTLATLPMGKTVIGEIKEAK